VAGVLPAQHLGDRMNALNFMREMANPQIVASSP
jgi:hypothetical protein